MNQPSKRTGVSRRTVLKSTAAFGPVIVSARVLGQNAPSNRITLGFIGLWGICYLAFANAFPRVRAVLMTSPYRDEVQVPVNPETMEPLPAHE